MIFSVAIVSCKHGAGPNAPAASPVPTSSTSKSTDLPPVESAPPKSQFPLGPDSKLIDPSNVIQKLAFASRGNPSRSQPLWEIIAAIKPNLFVSTGDLVEPNFASASDISENYKLLRLQPEFARFRTHFALFSIWGAGDSADISEEKSAREVAKLEYLKFYNNDSPAINPRQNGIYHGLILGSGKSRLHLIFLDTHYFKILAGDDAQLLGSEQWNWITGEIQKPAEVTVFVLSEPFLSENNKTSIWWRYPKERLRLENLLRAYGKITHQKTILILSNTGFGEFRQLKLAANLEVFESSAGGINRRAIQEPEKTKLRIGKPVADLNFGLLSFDWNRRKVSLKLIGPSGKSLNEKNLDF